MNTQNLLDLSHSSLVVVTFGAPWCGGCNALTPTLTQLAKEFDTVTFHKINVDESPEVAEDFGIRALPTILFLRAGKALEKRIVGNTSPVTIKNAILENLS